MSIHDDSSGSDLGAFTLDEFCQLFKISRGLCYKERRAGRLIFSRIGDRTIVTKHQARQYQRLLEAEAQPELAAATSLSTA
jgi:hypothetical protein